MDELELESKRAYALQQLLNITRNLINQTNVLPKFRLRREDIAARMHMDVNILKKMLNTQPGDRLFAWYALCALAVAMEYPHIAQLEELYTLAEQASPPKYVKGDTSQQVPAVRLSTTDSISGEQQRIARKYQVPV